MADDVSPGLPAALLWDMDGTLVDTEPYWIETEFALADRYGGTWSRAQALDLVGNDLLTSGRYIREHMGIDLTPERIVEELLDGVVARVEQAVPWVPGARELRRRALRGVRWDRRCRAVHRHSHRRHSRSRGPLLRTEIPAERSDRRGRSGHRRRHGRWCR